MFRLNETIIGPKHVACIVLYCIVIVLHIVYE